MINIVIGDKNMATYTKYTVVTFETGKTENYDENEAQFIADNQQALTSFVQRGETINVDSSISVLAINRIKRYWVDQESAEEWKNIILTNSEKYNVPLSVEIFDNDVDPEPKQPK